MKGKLLPNITTIQMSIRIPEEESICFLKNGSFVILKKKIKSDNRIWNFHREDVDPFPSKLHAHDYAHGEILDALTGDIYSKATKKIIRKLGKKQLRFIKQELDKNNFKIVEN